MKYYLIAGEASGDLHGSNLIKSLRSIDPAANVRCWGGDKMQAAGATVVKHIKDLAFMGFAEVIKNLPVILKNIRFCKKDILSFNPDVLVLIDYPGFNLRIARWAKPHSIKTVYYISPQLWAWKEGRVHTIRQSVDKMLVIFPFEKEFYKKWQYDVEYVGHPLVRVIENYQEAYSGIQKVKGMVALLPGSRKQEIRAKLPIMLEATKKLQGLTFFVAKAPSIDTDFYSSFLKEFPAIQLHENTYSLLMQAEVAAVTSGTATLETALFNVPEVVCYKTGNISYAIGKRLIKLRFICIVNLIMNKEVVKELIQYDLTADNLANELKLLQTDSTRRNNVLEDYKNLKHLLEFNGDASQNAAEIIFSLIR